MKEETIFIGCDPDVRNLSFVFMDEDKKILRIILSKIPKSEKIPVPAQVKQIIRYAHTFPIDHQNGMSVRAAVESQNARYASRQGIDVQSLIGLATISGASAAFLDSIFLGYDLQVTLPLPAEWKGSAPKHVFNARTCKKMGWDYIIKGNVQKGTAYAVPQLSEDQMPPVTLLGGKKVKFNDGDWADVLDSVGLALWIREKELR